MSSCYRKTQPHTTRKEICFPHFCSWGWSAPGHLLLRGGCGWGCNVPCRKTWGGRVEQSHMRHFPLLPRRWKVLSIFSRGPLPPCWWGAEPPNAFSQGELHEKGKGWIPPWTYFFPPSSLQCVDNLLLQPHLCPHPTSELEPEPVPRDSPRFCVLQSSTTQVRREGDLSPGSDCLFHDLGVRSSSDVRAPT